MTNTLNNKLALVVFTFLIAGCATGYQATSFSGGYKDLKIQDGLYKISFEGNGYTSMEKAADFALLRAAELALEQGYPFFVIAEHNNAVKNESFTTPVTANTQGTYRGSSRNLGTYAAGSYYGTENTRGSYSSTTTYSGGETYNIEKPRTRLTVEYFRGRPINYPGTVYEAKQVQTNIKNQYGVS